MIKKLVLIMMIVMGVCCFLSCKLKEVEVVLPDKSEKATLDNNFSTSESRRDFEEFITGEKQEDEEFKYDLDIQVASFSKTEIIGEYDKDSKFVTCKVTAPDVYSYLIENTESLINMETEELYQNIMAYIQSKECKMRTAELEVPAKMQGNKLVIDTTSAKYQDAINGGMNSALTEIYVLWFMEMNKGE